jgi:hypothetical protein
LAVQYDIRKVQENQVGLKLNGIHNFLVYADYVNLLGDNINIIKENTEALIHSSKEAGLGVNTEKTKYMLISRHQNAGQNHNIKIANRSFENVAKFRYLRMTVINQDLINEEIKSRVNSGNTCYHSVENLVFSYLLCKNVNNKMNRSIILPIVLYGCETWSVTLVFENRVLRGIFRPKRDEITRG